MLLAALPRWLAVVEPSFVTAKMATMAINATTIAYSTSVAPSSLRSNAEKSRIIPACLLRKRRWDPLQVQLHAVCEPFDLRVPGGQLDHVLRGSRFERDLRIGDPGRQHRDAVVDLPHGTVGP